MLYGTINHILNRRELARRTSACVAGLMTGSLLDRELFAAEGSNDEILSNVVDERGQAASS